MTDSITRSHSTTTSIRVPRLPMIRSIRRCTTISSTSSPSEATRLRTHGPRLPGTGTINTSGGSTVEPLIIVNHRNTTETTPSLYIDNIRFTVSTPAAAAAAMATPFPVATTIAEPDVDASLAEMDQVAALDFSYATLLLADRVESDEHTVARNEALEAIYVEDDNSPAVVAHDAESKDALANPLDDDLLAAVFRSNEL